MVPSVSLSIRGVSKQFGRNRVLRDVTFTFQRDQNYALIGANGSGKTTLLNLVSGYERPDRGTITFRGRPLSELSPSQIARLGVARTFQSVKVFSSLTVFQNLLVSLRDKADESLLGAIACRASLNSKRYCTDIEDRLGKFHLSEAAGHLAAALSFGQQKMLQLAMATANPFELLLLDEPVAGLQSSSSGKVLSLIRNLQKTTVVVEHDPDFIKALGATVLFLAEGKILCSGSYDEVMADPRVRESYL